MSVSLVPWGKSKSNWAKVHHFTSLVGWASPTGTSSAAAGGRCPPYGDWSPVGSRPKSLAEVSPAKHRRASGTSQSEIRSKTSFVGGVWARLALVVPLPGQTPNGNRCAGQQSDNGNCGSNECGDIGCAHLTSFAS